MKTINEIMELVEQHRCAGGSAEHAATKEALRTAIEAHGKACRAQALAQAVEICDGEKWVSQTGAHSIRLIDTYNGACDDSLDTNKESTSATWNRSFGDFSFA